MKFKLTRLDGVTIMQKRKEIIFNIPTGFGSAEFCEWKERNKKQINKIKPSKFFHND